MKMGVIIVFDLIEASLPIIKFVESFNKAQNVKFCLVNNNGDEQLIESLVEISDRCENVNTVNIKKSKGSRLAIRSGARFLSSRFDLKYLGYIQKSNYHDILESLNLFNIHKARIRQDLHTDSKSRSIKKIML